jgi:osmotically inducible protein OsmC
MMDKIDSVRYETSVTVTGGRVGNAVSEDGLLQLELSRPGAKSGTNPEQLLAAGWGACLLSTLHALGRRSDQDTDAGRVTVDVSLGTTSEGLFALRASIDVSLPQLDPPSAADLTRLAHSRCPYSRALAGSIEISLQVNGDPL